MSQSLWPASPGREVAHLARAVVMHRYAQLLHGQREGGKQLAVVQLPLARQQQALGKAASQGRVGGGHAGGIERLHGGQAAHLGLPVLEQAAQACGVARVLAVPDDERAVLLPVHGRGQRRDQLGPACQGMLAHAHDAGLGHHRLGQRRHHGRRHIGGRGHAGGPAGLENLHAMALARKAGGQQAAQEAGAQDGDR